MLLRREKFQKKGKKRKEKRKIKSMSIQMIPMAGICSGKGSEIAISKPRGLQAGMGYSVMYKIIIKKKAKKFIDGLPLNDRRCVVAAIEQQPNGSDIKPMKGHEGLLRLRVGSYRIIYTVDHGELIVL